MEIRPIYSSLIHMFVSRDSSCYGLVGRGVGARVPVRQNFSPLHVVQTDSGA
jgi:hypothetical protein